MDVRMAVIEPSNDTLETYEPEFLDIDAFLHCLHDEDDMNGRKAINGKYGFWMGYQCSLANEGKRRRTAEVVSVYEAARRARNFAKKCSLFQLRILLDSEEVPYNELKRQVRTALIREPSPKVAFVFSRNDDPMIHSTIDRLRP